MDTHFIVPFVNCLQNFPAEILSFIELGTCLLAIIFLYRFFQVVGLYVYTIVAIIVSNLQVLKLAEFSFFSEPIALGTIVFSSTFLASDIITEFHGRHVAQKSIGLSFFAQLLMTLLMVITLAYSPALSDKTHKSLEILFMPSVRLLVASLLSFSLSQFVDIWIFDRLRYLTASHHLWLRTGISFLFSGLLDSLVFSYLAWVILSPEPLGAKEVFTRYVLATYVSRILVSLVAIVSMYFCRTFIQKQKNKH